MPNNFTEDQKLRYSRNIILPEIGEIGQQKLLAAKVLIIGAGGLGNPVSMYLSAAGVGTIGIIDEDKIEISNLQRQVLYDSYYIGRPKVEIAAEKLHDLNSDVKIIPHFCRLDETNARKLISQYDIIADCSDNFPTRFLINDVCMELNKTLVSSAVAGFEGQVYVFKKGIASYRDIYAEPPEGLINSCSQAGILGSVAGVIGSLQATEIVKEIISAGKSLAGRMIIYNALSSSFKTISLAASAGEG